MAYACDTKYEKALKKLFEKNLQIDHLKILDVGCGSGKTTRLLKTLSNYVCGLDINDHRETDYSDFFEFVRGTAYALPFGDETFDLIAAFDIIEHVDDHKMMKETHRILKKQGRLLIGTPNIFRLSNMARNLFGHKVVFPKSYGKDPVLGEIIHLREYSIEDLCELLKMHGFKILQKQGVLLGGYLFGSRGQGFILPHKIFADFTHHLFILAEK